MNYILDLTIFYRINSNITLLCTSSNFVILRCLNLKINQYKQNKKRSTKMIKPKTNKIVNM